MQFISKPKNLLLFKGVKAFPLLGSRGAFPTSSGITRGVRQGGPWAFTLVELIVVVTILAILATVGFASYTSHLSSVRDTARVNQLSLIRDNIELYRRNKKLPLPTDYIEIKSNGTVIGYQGYAGESVLSDIKLQEGGKDPMDKTYYTYYVTKNKKNFQLLAFLEEEQTTSFNLLKTTRAESVDYEDRYAKVTGEKLGVLTESGSNTPVQEVSSLITAGELDFTIANTDYYIAYLDDEDSIKETGANLLGVMQTLSEKGGNFGSPENCPSGFIKVPGNTGLGQPGFCVAKYEMSYEGAATPTSATSYNRVVFVLGKTPVSEAGLYPITGISQLNAISACKSMGNGYHLITNKERMTVARNIENQAKNWSNGVLGDGFIHNGVSGDSLLGCDAKGGNTETYNYATKSGIGDENCNPKRSYILSNGEVIWDLAGNVWEHVNRSNNIYAGTAQEVEGNGDLCTATDLWFTSGSPLSTCYETYGPINNQGGTDMGMGQMFNSTGTNKVFLRSGEAGTTPTNRNGIFSLYLGWNSSSSGQNTGFRCAK